VVKCSSPEPTTNPEEAFKGRSEKKEGKYFFLSVSTTLRDRRVRERARR
jgi:hypothetical protein